MLCDLCGKKTEPENTVSFIVIEYVPIEVAQYPRMEPVKVLKEYCYNCCKLLADPVAHK
jgi:hypothetical protein